MSIVDVVEYPLVSRNEDYKFYYAIEEAAAKKHLKLNYCLRTSDALAIINMINDNHTVAFFLDLIERRQNYVFIPLSR